MQTPFNKELIEQRRKEVVNKKCITYSIGDGENKFNICFTAIMVTDVYLSANGFIYEYVVVSDTKKNQTFRLSTDLPVIFFDDEKDLKQKLYDLISYYAKDLLCTHKDCSDLVIGKHFFLNTYKYAVDFKKIVLMNDINIYSHVEYTDRLVAHSLNNVILSIEQLNEIDIDELTDLTNDLIKACNKKSVLEKRQQDSIDKRKLDALTKVTTSNDDKDLDLDEDDDYDLDDYFDDFE